MTGDKGNGERWLNIAGSLASLAALGYLLTHLPRRGERSTPVAGLGAAPKAKVTIKNGAIMAGKKKIGSISVEYMDGLAVLESIYIDKKERGKGYGAAVMREAKKAAKKKGASNFVLNIPTSQGVIRLANSVFGEPVECAWDEGLSCEGLMDALPKKAPAWFERAKGAAIPPDGFPQANVSYKLAGLPTKGRIDVRVTRKDRHSFRLDAFSDRKPVGQIMVAAPKSRKLGALPKFPDLTISSRISKSRVGNPDTLIVEAFTANQHEAGHVTAMGGDDYAIVMTAGTSPKYRGVGLYPVMLTMLRDLAKERGYKGIVSEGEGRIDAKSTRAWEKFAAREPRVRRQGEDFFFSGLPTKGRIPLATAKRAINRLGRKAKACGITPALLREGMEVEREHRDVTGGRVSTTAKIAAAHICEDKQYYRKLKRYIEK